MVGDGVLIDLGQRALLGADRTGEVPEVVDRQRQVGVERFADRLAVVPGFGDREHLEVLLHPVGDLIQDHRPFSHRGLTPGRRGLVGGVEGEFDILGRGLRDLGEGLAGDRGDVLEVVALDRLDPVAADVVVVTGLEGDLGALRSRLRVDSHGCSSLRRLEGATAPLQAAGARRTLTLWGCDADLNRHRLGIRTQPGHRLRSGGEPAAHLR